MGTRLGDEERRPMDLVPAPAVRLMKRRVLSRPGVNSLMSYAQAWDGRLVIEMKRKRLEMKINSSSGKYQLNKSETEESS